MTTAARQVERLRELLADVDHGWIAAEQTHGEWYGIQSEHFALGNMFNEADAKITVAAVNALPDLLATAEAHAALVKAVEGLRDAAVRDRDYARNLTGAGDHREANVHDVWRERLTAILAATDTAADRGAR